MGKIWDFINYGMSKEEYERQLAIEIAVNKLREKDFCSNCGKKAEVICQKKTIFSNCEKALCSDCAKKCKRCGKYFCDKHLNNHKCR